MRFTTISTYLDAQQAFLPSPFHAFRNSASPTQLVRYITTHLQAHCTSSRQTSPVPTSLIAGTNRRSFTLTAGILPASQGVSGIYSLSDMDDLGTSSMSTNADSTQEATDQRPNGSNADAPCSSPHSQPATSWAVQSTPVRSALEVLVAGVASRLRRMTTHKRKRNSGSSTESNFSQSNDIRLTTFVEHDQNVGVPPATPESPVRATTSEQKPSESESRPGVEEQPTSSALPQDSHVPCPSSAGRATSLPTPPSSALGSRDQSAVPEQPSNADFPDDFTPLRRYTTYRTPAAASPPNNHAQQSNKDDETAPQTPKSPSRTSSNASSIIGYRGYIELKKEWVTHKSFPDSIESHRRAIRFVRAVFQQQGVTTRAERREYLKHEKIIPSLLAVKWLYEHPADLWTDEDEERGWSPIFADKHAELSAKAYEEHGYYRTMIKDCIGTQEESPEDEMDEQDEQPEQIELHQAQAHCFGNEWAFGDGNWGPSKKPVEEEELGPKNERWQDL